MNKEILGINGFTTIKHITAGGKVNVIHTDKPNAVFIDIRRSIRRLMAGSDPLHSVSNIHLNPLFWEDNDSGTGSMNGLAGIIVREGIQGASRSMITTRIDDDGDSGFTPFNKWHGEISLTSAFNIARAEMGKVYQAPNSGVYNDIAFNLLYANQEFSTINGQTNDTVTIDWTLEI